MNFFFGEWVFHVKNSEFECVGGGSAVFLRTGNYAIREMDGNLFDADAARKMDGLVKVRTYRAIAKNDFELTVPLLK